MLSYKPEVIWLLHSVYIFSFLEKVLLSLLATGFNDLWYIQLVVWFALVLISCLTAYGAVVGRCWNLGMEDTCGSSPNQLAHS